MTNKQLANILAQFLYNITLDDLKRILTANKSTIYAQMNLPLSEQLQADKFLKETIEDALNGGSQEDIKRLSNLISYEVSNGI